MESGLGLSIESIRKQTLIQSRKPRKRFERLRDQDDAKIPSDAVLERGESGGEQGTVRRTMVNQQEERGVRDLLLCCNDRMEIFLRVS